MQDLRRSLYGPGLFAISVVALAIAAASAFAIFSALIEVFPSTSTVPDIRKEYAGLVKPEPVESAVFGFCVVVGLALFICAGVRWARTRPSELEGSIVAASFGIGMFATLFWFVRIDWSTMVPGFPGYTILSTITDWQSFWQVCTIAAVSLLVVGAISSFQRLRFLPAFLVGLPLIVLGRMVVLGNDDYYPVYAHYEVFVYPLIQDWLGTGINVGPAGQSSQYGMYPIFLRPIWWLVGEPSTTPITVTMAALLVLSLGAQVAFMARFTAQIMIGLVFTMLAIAVTMFLHSFWPIDPYFQFFPLRMVFPSLALAMVCWKQVRDRPLLCYLALSPGLIWNFESGFVGLATYSAFVVASTFVAGRSNATRLLIRHLGLAAVGILSSILVLSIYYMSRFGTLPDLVGIISGVRGFSSGIGAEPMPLFGAWSVHAIIYAAAIYISASRIMLTSAGSEDRLKAAALFAMAIAGMVWLRYYQGRSVSAQLVLVSAPAMLCLGMIVDRAMASSGRFQAVLSTLLAATVGAPLLTGFGFWLHSGPAQMRSMASIVEQNGGQWNVAVARTIEAFKATIRDKDDNLLVLAPYGHLVHLKMGKPGPIRSAGLCQIWYKSELQQIVEAVSDPQTRMIVADHTDSCSPGQDGSNASAKDPSLGIFVPEIADIIRRDYTEVSPDSLRGRAFLRRQN